MRGCCTSSASRRASKRPSQVWRHNGRILSGSQTTNNQVERRRQSQVRQRWRRCNSPTHAAVPSCPCSDRRDVARHRRWCLYSSTEDCHTKDRQMRHLVRRMVRHVAAAFRAVSVHDDATSPPGNGRGSGGLACGSSFCCLLFSPCVGTVANG